METSNLKNKLCKANFIVFLAGYQTQLQVLDQNHYYVATSTTELQNEKRKLCSRMFH